MGSRVAYPAAQEFTPGSHITYPGSKVLFGFCWIFENEDAAISRSLSPETSKRHHKHGDLQWATILQSIDVPARILSTRGAACVQQPARGTRRHLSVHRRGASGATNT
uniref:Uncharacterized protein n=1 Tax=Heliothis virescens TaxID=7102 RepID=A0A2A4J454_HELVI